MRVHRNMLEYLRYIKYCLYIYIYPVPLSRNVGTLTSWKSLGLSRPVMGLLYLFYTYTHTHTHTHTHIYIYICIVHLLVWIICSTQFCNNSKMNSVDGFSRSVLCTVTLVYRFIRYTHRACVAKLFSSKRITVYSELFTWLINNKKTTYTQFTFILNMNIPNSQNFQAGTIFHIK